MKPGYVLQAKPLTLTPREMARINRRIDTLSEKFYPAALETFTTSKCANRNRQDFEFINRCNNGKWKEKNARDLARSIVSFWVNFTENRGNSNVISAANIELYVVHLDIISTRFYLDADETGVLLLKLVELSKK